MPEPNVRFGTDDSRPTSTSSGIANTSGSRLPVASDTNRIVPRGNDDVAVGDVLRRDAHGALHRAEVAHRLVDRPRREPGIGDEPPPLVRVAEQQRDRAGELVAGGVGAGHEHRLGEHDQLVGREPVAVLLHRDQRRRAGRRADRHGVRVMSAATYSSSSPPACSIAGRSSARFWLKIRKISVAQCENRCQSSRGAPSSSQMIGIGYGSQTSATKSHSWRSSIAVEQLADHLGHERPEPAGGRGVNAGDTSRRTRVCSSPSIERIDGRRCSISAPSTPCICGRSESAEWNRRSRSSATASA